MRVSKESGFNLFKGINRNIVAALVLMFVFVGCTPKEDEEPWSPYKSKATIDYTTLAFNQTSVSGRTSGDPRYTWTIAVLEGNTFCRPQASNGAVGSQFTLLFDRNENEDTSRTAKVVIGFTDGYSATFIIEQLGETTNVTYERAWGEQPGYVENNHYIYKTYYTTLHNGKRVRNFSVCYDTVKVCSRWVAYPIHSSYTSSKNYETGSTTAGRTNAWAFDDAISEYKYASNYNEAYYILSNYVKDIDSYDTFTLPIIPQRRQADIRFRNGIGGGYARGHMIPSASRYSTWNTNAQTCYSTNIMAQDYDFNGGSWGKLEIAVRNKAVSDTLFVVVGTLFENTKTVTNKDQATGKTHCNVSVPSHCYKLLLRTRNGKTGKRIQDITSADELMCIGFLFANSSSEEKTSLSSAACSVADIEKRAGVSFFRNLNPAIADKVKSQNKYSDWNL